MKLMIAEEDNARVTRVLAKAGFRITGHMLPDRTWLVDYTPPTAKTDPVCSVCGAPAVVALNGEQYCADHALEPRRRAGL